MINYWRSLGLKPIGYLNMLGHLDRAYQKYPYTQRGGIDVRSDDAYDKFVYPILTEMLEVYGPIEYFHCGMDEAWELFTWLSKERFNVTDLITRHVRPDQQVPQGAESRWSSGMTCSSRRACRSDLVAPWGRPTAARLRIRRRR